MGMGEPLQNYDSVTQAIRGLQRVLGLNPARITVSTVGVRGKIRALARDAPGVRLAVSLHAPTQVRMPSAAVGTAADRGECLDARLGRGR